MTNRQECKVAILGVEIKSKEAVVLTAINEKRAQELAESLYRFKNEWERITGRKIKSIELEDIRKFVCEICKDTFQTLNKDKKDTRFCSTCWRDNREQIRKILEVEND